MGKSGTRPEDVLYKNAMENLRAKALECELIGGEDAGPGDDAVEYCGWIVGVLPDDEDPKYASFYLGGHTPEAERALKDRIAGLPCDPKADYITPLQGIRASDIPTAAILIRMRNQRGEHSWLLYHHPNIDSDMAGGYLQCSLEAEIKKLRGLN